MKVMFWVICAVIIITALYILRALMNISTSTIPTTDTSSINSLTMILIAGLLILGGGLYLYFTNHVRWACLLVSSPILLLFLYYFFFLILPYIMGERMN